MATNAVDRQLAQLEASRYRFGRHEAPHVLKLLRRLDAARFPDPASLIRFHEALLFLRAFPQGPEVVRATERILNSFHKKVESLRNAGADMDGFDTFEFSGIAGTQMEDTLSFDVAGWLINRLPGKVEIAWENYEQNYELGRELGNTGPRFMPLLADDAYVEADTPWRRWLEAAAGERKKKPHATPAWLISRFEQLPLPAQQKAELYESLRVPLRWNLENSSITRTRNWKPVRNIFYHGETESTRSDRRGTEGTGTEGGGLIARSQVSLATELARRPPLLTRLSRRQGERVIDLIREVMLVRYRELYGTTLGDPSSVVRADLFSGQARSGKASRGVSIYLWNLPTDRRLPLRAYVAGLTLKNGVSINYIEAIGLCEWMEVGFNTFYTFRGGETGWVYAQVLRCLCHFMGTTCVSVYPYQLGHDNEEAIESGAFWFYRKLGFRPGRADLRKLVEREEAKIAAEPKYRTPARTLRRLAEGHVFYELPGSDVGAWDAFSTRSIGLRVNRRMAQDFQGDSGRMRKESLRAAARILGLNTSSRGHLDMSASERATLEEFALFLTMIPGLASWKREEKEALVRIIRSKSKADEMVYLRLTQRHQRLREALLKLGSS